MRYPWLLALLALSLSGCGSWLSGSSRPLHGPAPQDFVSGRTAAAAPELTPGQRYHLQADSPQRTLTGTVAEVTSSEVVLRDVVQATHVVTGVPRDDSLLGRRHFQAVDGVQRVEHFSELSVPKAEITAMAAADPPRP